MGEVVIQIEDVWKKYRLGLTNYTTLQEEWANLWQKKSERETIWALQAIDLQIKQGETLGLIGKNGSGKSTLLKILSRITLPTRGRVCVKGKMSSLLEVGTGFHPELSGRENIYLNGAILGMRKQEITQQLAAIVDFAGVEPFIDTPIKRYSSGMYLRLAFAVAAHLRNDIVVIDEVLAVGDLEFQKKCLGKLHHLAETGKTALVVSHQLGLIENICNRVVVLNEGKVAFESQQAILAIQHYQNMVLNYIDATNLAQRTDRQRHPQFLLYQLELLDEQNQAIQCATTGKYLKIRFRYRAERVFSEVGVSIRFKDLNGATKTLLWTKLLNQTYETNTPEGYFDCIMPKLALSASIYILNVLVETPFEKLDWIQNVDSLSVLEGQYYENSPINSFQEGLVFTDFRWE
ncbi:MAG: ABC transporter ATP-binding protein [Microscillaceae bacterium]|jgi:lipopolysaccharide transport system ATP-binding protein|nr:ABC transporter ATP-binding protein [Microscillaceae bacterium]